MAITIPYEDAATIGTTEYSLTNDSTTIASQTDDGVYQCMIDFANMTTTEKYQIKVKEKVQAGGTQRDIYTSVIEGVQGEPFVIPSLILANGWDITLKKLAGTDRSIGWSIRKVA